MNTSHQMKHSSMHIWFATQTSSVQNPSNSKVQPGKQQKPFVHFPPSALPVLSHSAVHAQQQQQTRGRTDCQWATDLRVLHICALKGSEITLPSTSSTSTKLPHLLCMLPGVLSNHKPFGCLPAMDRTASILNKRHEVSLPAASLLKIMPFHLGKKTTENKMQTINLQSHKWIINLKKCSSALLMFPFETKKLF